MSSDSKEAAAIRLVELSHEAASLEGINAAILQRLETIRDELQASAQRLTAVTATIDLLCEHLGEVGPLTEEASQIEDEIRKLSDSVSQKDNETKQMLFEANSLKASLQELDEEAEQLSQLLDGRSRRPRGH